MFKAIYQDKIIAINETDNFPCLVYDSSVEDTDHNVDDFVHVDGEFLLKQDVPVEYQNEQIRQERQARYVTESDPLHLDYDEALARGSEDAEQLKQDWLASKDRIREELPYIEE
jgi:hypothetical protein